MEVDFGLAHGPLTSKSGQENDLSFHRLNVVFSMFDRRVLVAPDVQHCLRVTVSPRIPVIAMHPRGPESRAEASPH